MESPLGAPSGARDQEFQGGQDRSSPYLHGVYSPMKEVDKQNHKETKKMQIIVIAMKEIC